MLQRLLIITLTLCSLSASAQWQQTGAKVRYVNGLGIPTKDTAAGVAADSSQILIRPADSSLYIKYKRTWVKVGAGGGGTIGGSGTTNYVPKFTAGTTLGNSQIFDDGTNVGIGTATPTTKLDVVGGNGDGLQYRTSTRSIGIGQISNEATLYWGSSNPLIFFAGSELMRITSAGNVGIGYTAPAAKLSVSGTTLINTNTDNGVDKLQVSGSMNVSARATAQNLSVTNNGSITNDLTVGKTIYSGSSASGSVNGLVVTSGNEKGIVINTTNSGSPADQTRLTWQHNGATRGLFYYSEAGETFSFQSSGASRKIQIASEAGVGFYMTGSNTNVRIGDNTAANAKLSVAGTTLINTNTDNGVDKLQVNGSIYSSSTLKGNDISIVGTGTIPTLTSTQFLTQSFSAQTNAKTANYTTAFNDYFIDCTSGTFTVTLQAAASYQGRVLIIKNSGAGTITVDGNGAETIDGAATYSLAVQYATVQIMSDGTNWKIIAKF
jgi:hypothetical protein